MNRWRRAATAALTAAALLAASLVAFELPTAAAANENSLWFGQVGETHGNFGPNTAVRIGGDLAFNSETCPEGGVPDFVYPTSDVYIVAPGAAQGELHDVTGGSPNTVVQYGTIFDGEVIGITSPAGKLGAGTYDIVFDTCQDGAFEPDEDAVFAGALTVSVPAVLPPADAALTSLKDASYDEYLSWKLASKIMDAIWKLAEKATKVGCDSGSPIACAMKKQKYYSQIQEQFTALLLNQGKHYLAIYEDPPNPDFDQPVVAPRVEVPADAIGGEGALTEALLRSVEAYKGAQQAGDGQWTLVHAREARDLYEALGDQLAATSRRLADLKALYGTDAEAGLRSGYEFRDRVMRQGFTPDERRTLRENGLTAAQVTQLETDVRTSYGPAYGADAVRDAFAQVIAAHEATATAVTQGRQAWAAIVDALAADARVPDTHPVASAGGPYSVTEGASVTLDASASVAADGATPSAYAWDLDGDRDFDDTAGTTPAMTFDEPGAPVVGVRVTDGGGRTAYAWTTVTVVSKGADPQITGASPDVALLTVETAKTAAFSVTATDDGGTPPVTWTVDGKPAGEGSSLSWPAPTTPGTHQVAATATDGDGHQATRAWTVLVHRTDADGDAWTATTDCDDGDAAVHPGQIEFLGNGVDDDCDAGSPDAPPGGLTGRPYGWGLNSFGQTGKGVLGSEYHTPQTSVLPNTVVQVEMGFRTGYAVLADGSARAWGYNLDGALGDGSTASQRATPVPVAGVDGAGTLAGVTRISAHDSHAAAVRTDGTVVTWGGNANRQLGNGSTVGSRNVPGLVLTAADTPLTGARDVESGEGADYALMADGTVKAWGNVTCAGASTDVKPYATTVPGLTGIRQIATGSSAVFFVRTDGTVLSCGATDSLLGRAFGNMGTPTSAYLPNPVTDLGRGSKVVDVSSNGSAAVVLKEDGSVFMWGESTNDDLSVLGLPRGGSASAPTPVSLPDGPPVVGVEKDASQTTLAIRADGSMLAWGGNLYGVTGTGRTGTVSVPTPVSLPGQVFLQASTSSWNALALTRPAADPDLELPASWVSATVDDASLSEASGGAFTVKLDHPLTDDVALTWSLRPDTAGEDDVALGTGTVVVKAGQTEAAIPVDVTDDALDEDDETVTLALTGARLGLTIARAQAAGTIADDDNAPTVSVDPATVAEGGTSLTDAPVRVRLSKPSGKEVVAAYTTAAGTATAGKDYVRSAASLRFAPGETERVIHLSVHGDALVEPDETFTVALGDVTNGTAGGAGTVTIADDEVLTVSVTAPALAEGTSGTFVVTVQPAPAPGTTVSVPWSLTEPQAGPADEPGDIATAGGRLELDAEHPSATITATTVDDSTAESPEPFQVVLGDLAASDGRAVLRGEVGTAWITDNDRANRPPVVHTAGQASGVEGSALALDGTVSDDAAGVISSWTVDGPCAVTGEGPQSSATCADDGVYTATLTAVDSDGASVSGTTTLTVANAAPVLGDVAVDAAGARIEFSDAGPLDQHTCTVDWGDQTTTGALDGAVSPCYLPHNYGVGTFTATVTVTDDDNGSVSATRTVKVTSAAWPFRGFLRPVDNPPAINVVKAGQSIPVKFGLGGYRGMNILAAGSPASGTVTCGGGEPNAVEETVTAGGSSLSYDAGDDHYTYVWKTSKVWAGQCRRLVVTLTDGTQHWAEFQFR